MQHEHHDLIHEFPEYREEIHNLKVTNEHFREIFDAYHKIDKEVYRVENNIEPRSDTEMEDLKKRRLALKDELFQILRQSKPQTNDEIVVQVLKNKGARKIAVFGYVRGEEMESIFGRGCKVD